jgi:hypothetical protein
MQQGSSRNLQREGADMKIEDGFFTCSLDYFSSFRYAAINEKSFFINSKEDTMALIDGALPRANAIARGAAKGIKDLARLRLVTGSTLILVSLVGLLGADWDIQWHAVVGRDRTFTPPHDLILISIGLSGIVVLIGTLECEPATCLGMGLACNGSPNRS